MSPPADTLQCALNRVNVRALNARTDAHGWESTSNVGAPASAVTADQDANSHQLLASYGICTSLRVAAA